MNPNNAKHFLYSYAVKKPFCIESFFCNIISRIYPYVY
jgi:hypothetical protein